MDSLEFDYTHESFTLQGAIDAILQRELDPRAIDDYAEDALCDLIEVVDGIVHTHANTNISGAEQERAALVEAGLDPMVIEKTLDHIADVADRIQSYDQLLVQKTHLTNTVILPPNPDRIKDIVPGNGNFEKPKELVPKLRTLLLVLDKVFNIDVRDDNAVHIESGVIRPDMMRGVSYSAVSIPELERTIFACDEIDNTTFVFDSTRCEERNIMKADLYDYSKDDLHNLIEDNPRIGVRVNYSKQYANNLIEVLQESLDTLPSFKQSTIARNKRRHILQPDVPLAPEGYSSATGISKMMGVDKATVAHAITELGDQLGDISVYRYGVRKVASYSPEQTMLITELLSVRLNTESAPNDVKSVMSIAKELPADPRVVRRAIEQLGAQLGEVKKYRFGASIVTQGYSREQVGMMRNVLSDYLDIPNAPEGYLSMAGISKEFNVSYEKTRRTISGLKDRLDETRIYRFGAQRVEGYSPEQIAIISEALSTHLETPDAPEGYLSKNGIVKELHTYAVAVQQAIDELGGKLGEVRVFKFKPQSTIGYSPAQIEMIRLHLKK